MTTPRRSATILLVAALLLAGVATAQAQEAPPVAPEDAARLRIWRLGAGLQAARGPGVRLDGWPFSAAHLYGLPLRGLGLDALALGTRLQVSVFDADPATGADAVETLVFTYGVDSEIAFARAFRAALEGATHVRVEVGAQERVIDFSTIAVPADGRGLLPRELAGRLAITLGRAITVDFYDGDPVVGAAVVESLRHTVGEDSLAGFAAAFASAARDAAFAVVTTEPYVTTVDLTARPILQPHDRLRGARPRILLPGRGR